MYFQKNKPGTFSLRYSLRISVALVFLLTTNANANNLDIYEGDSFEAAVENLSPGDTLTVHQGTYIDSGRISVTVKGSVDLPVLITSASGENRPHITRNASDTAQNTINIEGASYLTIRGIEISSNGGDGINLNSNPAYITLENLVIHDIDVGVNFRSSMHHITVTGNNIYDLGVNGGTGEGMYVGCNYATCAVSDSLLADNWIHNTSPLASQGDGIEIKRGSHSNIIRNNTIHDTNFPCILLYGTEGNPRNIVENNILWNCGDSGIQAAADVLIRNNVIFPKDSANGFNSQSHQGVSPNNLEFAHNTLIGGDPCLRLSGWSDKQDMRFVNNAVYCQSDNFKISGVNNVIISGNVIYPATSSLPNSGFKIGRSLESDFINIDMRNVMPTADSALIAAGDPLYVVETDLMGTLRKSAPDAGAYTSNQKNSNIAMTLSSDPPSVKKGETTTLKWTSSESTSCVASGGWSNNKPLNGSEIVGPITIDTSFALTCSGPNGSTRKVVTITINNSTGSLDRGETVGGALNYIGLLFLLFSAVIKSRLARRAI